jgi:hypothetical protein
LFQLLSVRKFPFPELTRTCPKFVSLTGFIEGFGWQYSDLDIVDRREIKPLDPENFWRYIGKSEVPLEEPGHLSAVTVAKGHRIRSEFARLLYRRIRRLPPALGYGDGFCENDSGRPGVRARKFRSLLGGA